MERDAADVAGLPEETQSAVSWPAIFAGARTVFAAVINGAP